MLQRAGRVCAWWLANITTRTGSDTPEGAAQVMVGTSGFYRLDAYQSGPLSEDTYYAIGSFLRQNDGFRDAGFPTDSGGQIWTNLKHDFNNSFIKVSGQYANDHNIFYLSLPVAIRAILRSASTPISIR